MQIPKITGEYQILFQPTQAGDYVNDHTIIRDPEGHWHLFGITSHGGGAEYERYFVHAKSRGTRLAEPMEEQGIVINNGTRAWAPCVIEHNGFYYMYYGPSPTKLDVSYELTHWMGYEITLSGHPVLSAHRDHMVLRDGDRWLMYVVGIKDRYSALSVFSSQDLLHWNFADFALTSSGDAPLNPPWGAFESPYVVRHNGLYYLFITYTDCSLHNYRNTLVFCSPDPLHFGDYTASRHADMVIAELDSHAGEVICADGQYYITTCGWRDCGIPHEGAVSIAELRFL